ncbi:UDP-N-acetylglucosamine diphosphorylase/glucosamine-1-phosphate N-acetyltransferase [Suicoccus acidiformans]|uniref:Bifunctional protein GlmU n=1 Tax=Suicoccus acidiformans TaxID=2036206 RepID=A0A347WND6_9LACT|nr:bifunctional UDP-N-acetylglucosamine diphosphorylase/glucosamine-1-phosphate N-acetyltransferase GlmU [Suicoccus acidiformans]AXY26593.1 UDP-N-acetylglucosamine diphosphorylase/glucosamine-1-phosphate N-acetyltransferase [Suicoccus acidiformans]
MSQRFAIVLAAGKGTRMKSERPKVLHEINGLSMIEHIFQALKKVQVDKLVTVVGHEAERVQSVLAGQCDFALQAEQLGTGHAVLQARDVLESLDGTTIVVSGDTPLLSGETLEELFTHHESSGAKGTILTAEALDPTGYGRVVRSEDGKVAYIVEHKDASEAEQRVREINTGTYIFDNRALFEALKQVGNDNAQGEYYLPDVIAILKNQGDMVDAFMMENFDEGMGVNDRVALSTASRLMTQRINEKHMLNGVTFVNPETTYIEVGVEIGPDTVIEGNVSIKGQTRIGAHCEITSGSEIIDSQIGDYVQVRSSSIESSQVGNHSDIGPMAHLRPNAQLGEYVHIGNFVEVKNAQIGDHTKAGHLSYIGDATLGRNINIGCGTTFVNFDGKKKSHTTVGDDSFIGSGVNLIAPLNIAPRSVLAAGSTIYEDVHEETLAIARSTQTNKANYWSKFNNK